MSRPNIIFIVADDLGFADLGCYGGRPARFGEVSPVLDALAEQTDMNGHPDLSSFGGIVYAANRISQLHVLVKEGRVSDNIDLLTYSLGQQNYDRHLRCYAELKRISSLDSKQNAKYV